MKYLDLDDDFVRLDYEMLYSRYSEADLTEVEIHTFQELNPRRDGIYLNWGCGAWSKSVEALRKDGWNIWGYEPNVSPDSNHVYHSTDQFTSKFDGIFSTNVIEHFRRPVDQFTEFHSILNDGAVMVHSSPCYSWSYAYTRFHNYFPLGRSPDMLARRTGFEVVGRGGLGQYLSATYLKR